MAELSKDERLYLQMGIAALIPGMQRAIEVMQAELDKYRAILADAQNGRVRVLEGVAVEEAPAARKRGRPKGSATVPAVAAVVKTNGGTAGFWARMTSKKRKAVMARRVEVARAGAAAAAKTKIRPQVPGHPEHAKWRPKARARLKKTWASYTPK